MNNDWPVSQMPIKVIIITIKSWASLKESVYNVLHLNFSSN